MDKANAIDVVNREIEGLFLKPLTNGSVDLLYKLISIRDGLNKDLYNELLINSANGKYDRDINALFEQYLTSRKENDEYKITFALDSLLSEISDIIVEIYNNATCEKERDIISKSILKMTRH